MTYENSMRRIACAVCLLLLPSIAAAQEKTVPTPANVKVEGMPPMPQSMLDRVARYGQFRQAQMIAWHPTKRQVLITTNFATPQLHLVGGPLRDRRQLTWFAAPGLLSLVDASFDPADGNMLAFHYDPAGAEARSIYRYDMRTGEPALVVEAQSRYNAVWSHQGKWLAYDSSERNGKDRDLYVVEPSNPATKRLVAALDGPWSPHDWSPDGSSVLVNEVFTNAENYLWLIDVKTGQKTPITKRGDGQKAAWLNARFSADGRKVYAVSDRGGEARIWRCDVAACAWTPVSADGILVDAAGGPHGSGGFELSADGSMIAYEEMEPASNSSGGVWVTKVGGGPSVQVSRDGQSVCWSPRGDWIYFHAERAGATDVYRVRAPLAIETGERVPFIGRVSVDRRREFGDLFDEAWSKLKDGFYDPNMHGGRLEGDEGEVSSDGGRFRDQGRVLQRREPDARRAEGVAPGHLSRK